MSMSKIIAWNFIENHGWKKFATMSQMIKDNAPLADIAKAMELSVAQISRYRDAMFYKSYVPHEGTLKVIDEYIDRDQINLDRKDTLKTKLMEGNIIAHNFRTPPKQA